MSWNVIWQVDPNDSLSCVERDWFTEIMSGVRIESVAIDYDRAPLLQLKATRPIVCVSCPNQTSQSDLIAYLKQLPRPRVLYHMSDEFAEIGRDLYEHCDLVIRNGSALFEAMPDIKIVQLPLGYLSSLQNASRVFSNASSRKIACSFLGTMKNEREREMLPALRAMGGTHHVRTTASFADATRNFNTTTITIYKNTTFVPNPKGNWNPECNRLYDALEWGCIPLIKTYNDSEYHRGYHDRLLGDHPIPTFEAWTEAADYARDLLLHPTELDRVQARLFNWWQSYKAELQIKIAHALADIAGPTGIR